MRKMTIAFASQDWSTVNDLSYPNGCTWYRCILPAAILNANGHECHVGLLHVEGSRFGLRIRKPMYKAESVAWGHSMLVFKLPMHSANLVAADMAKSKGIKVVVDIDDWFDGLPKVNRAWAQTDPESNPHNNRDIYFKVISMSDALICSTPFLFDFYKKKHPEKPIFLIRNSIDVLRWPKRVQRKSAPVIGWVGATPWRANDLEQLAPFMDEYLRTRGTKFHHSGHIPNSLNAASASDLLGVDKNRFSFVGMAPMTNIQQLFSHIDIGVVPLNDIPFNHAKSYLKGLEYGMAGIPFIASDTPEYRFLADAGVGRIARNADEWIYHMDELMNYKIRCDEAEFNLEIIKEKFSIESFLNQWETVYSQIMDIS